MDYMAKHCNQKGQQLDQNVTAQQLRGIEKLRNRESKGEIIISETDKSQHTTVSSVDSYTEQGNVHASKDRVISWKEYNEIHNMVQQHTKALCNVFQIGNDLTNNEETRVRENICEKSSLLA